MWTVSVGSRKHGHEALTLGFNKHDIKKIGTTNYINHVSVKERFGACEISQRHAKQIHLPQDVHWSV